ncbi:hypothetical protein V1291_005303 [Nitrobacteraceae bacterium AZCC 1564]
MTRAVFRWFVAVAIATGSLVAPSRWSVALAQDARSSPAVAQAGATCPSREFSAFFKAFSTRSDVQRSFTRFPLEYGKFNVDAIDTDEEFKTRLIERFEGVPLLNEGVIFPSKEERKKNRLHVKTITRGNSKHGPDADPESVINDSESATVTLFVPDTGFRIHYRFRRDSRCWFLYGISDRSI